MAALSLQQDFVAAVDFVQQVFPLAHFLLFFFPLSAKVTAVTNNAAVAIKNTFFIFMCFYFIKRKNSAVIANFQGCSVKI